MQTMPPMVMARAPKAGAVQPRTRKMALVAMRVAIVMPETGEDDEPTMPTMRAETVTNRKPKTTTRSAAAMLARRPTCAPGTGWNWRKATIRMTRQGGAAEDGGHGEIVRGAECGGGGCGVFRLFADLLDAFGERGDDGGRGAQEGDEAGGGDGSGTHGPDVGLPERGGVHLCDGRGAGVDGRGEMRAEEGDGGHHDEPGEDAAGEHDGGDADADDVADAEVFRGAIGADGGALEQVLGAEIGLVVRARGPEGEEIFVLEEGVEGAQAKAKKDAGRKGAAALAGDEDVGAGGAFGVDKGFVLVDDELPAQGDHEEDTEPSAEEGEGEDAGRFEIEAEENERGQGEDDAGRDGLAGVADGLDDVVFEDGRLAKGAQNGDGQDRDRDGRGHGKTGAQPNVNCDGTEDDREDTAEKERAKSELGAVFRRGNKGGEVLRRGHSVDLLQKPLGLEPSVSARGGCGRGLGLTKRSTEGLYSGHWCGPMGLERRRVGESSARAFDSRHSEWWQGARLVGRTEKMRVAGRRWFGCCEVRQGFGTMW